ncbi:OPT oligopeptide transporter protein-domain-containing protein [Aspergillus californicus]
MERHPTPEDDGTDTFTPFNDTEPDNRPILTFRAILVGALCGTLVNASNIYLGLEAGWTTGANIFGSLIGFVVLQRWSTSSFSRQAFGPHENNIVQTAATAAWGLSSVIVSAILAMYQLGLLQAPAKDYLHLTVLTGLGGLFGLFAIAPLRNFFLVQVARELDLRFPSSTATAITIRSMHQAIEGASMARQKLRVVLIAFTSALSLGVASQYAKGILWPSFESWGWFIEWAPAFIGSGMLVSMNVAISCFSGSILAWGVIGPYLVSEELAFGQHRSNETQWTDFMTYSSLSSELATADHPIARYWLLWPGVICMTTIAIAELACQWPIIWIVIRDGCGSLLAWLKQTWSKGYNYTSLHQAHEEKPCGDGIIKLWMWLPGVLVVIIVSCPVMRAQFGMPVPATLLALLLAFGMSLLAIQASDTTPLGTLSKVSQVVMAQRLNLIGGALTNIGASQATDLTGDFRVGFLLGTPATLQYATQIMGTVLATFISPLIFIIFATAYPCILSADTDPEEWEFSSPAARAWRVIAVAATELRMRVYHPNLMIMAMAFTLPATHYSIAMVVGSVIALVWRRRAPGAFREYGSALAAGLIAGEGIGGSVNAVLSYLVPPWPGIGGVCR